MEAAWRLAALVHAGRDEGMLPVEEAVVGLGTVTVVCDPRIVDVADLQGVLADLAGAAGDGRPAPDAGHGRDVGDAEAPLEVPVWFDGEDLEEVAAMAGRSAESVVDELCDCALRVAFLGFSPGFAYLAGLPPALAAVPRRDRPRPVVPAGSVALAGGFAAVYPQTTPGGWQLVGRTGLALFDPGRQPPAALGPGRAVRLRRAGAAPSGVAAPSRPALRAGGERALVVEQPGACTLVEDAGRRAVAGLGVPRAGAFDPVGLALANRLVGNSGDEAVLEVTGRGPELRARGAVQLAVVGDPGRPGAVDVRVEGRPAPEATVLTIGPGQSVGIGGTGGAVRAVVAVGGGLETPAVFGSRSADLLGGVGIGPLRAGDELGIGPARRPRGRLRFAPDDDDVVTLRVLAGPETAAGGLGDGRWTVGADSNRVWLRLTGAVAPAAAPGPVSRAMVPGAVQLPPGGELVMLGPDHATIGGYPVVGVVITADLHRLAHLAPGRQVRFETVDGVAARRALAHLDMAVAGAVSGWYPTVAG